MGYPLSGFNPAKEYDQNAERGYPFFNGRWLFPLIKSDLVSLSAFAVRSSFCDLFQFLEELIPTVHANPPFGKELDLWKIRFHDYECVLRSIAS